MNEVISISSSSHVFLKLCSGVSLCHLGVGTSKIPSQWPFLLLLGTISAASQTTINFDSEENVKSSQVLHEVTYLGWLYVAGVWSKTASKLCAQIIPFPNKFPLG